VDLGGRYISLTLHGDVQTAYVYDIKTGKLLMSLTKQGTYTVEGVKIWGRGGVFSGNGRFLVEDPRDYGTDAKVVDLETKTTYTIDWTGTAGDYYGVQMDYYGTIFAVGEMGTNGRVVVFERHGDTYEQIWASDPIGDIRRLFLTLDAKYLIYGALGHNNLYIAEKSGDSYTVIAQIPLEGGVGALTCTDPWKVGYILVGTDNGHIYIFDTHDGTRISNPELVLHLNSTQTGTTGRFYNPFYNRWSPIEVTIVAFSTNTVPYVSVLVDIHTGRYWIYSGSGVGKATAVSLQGNYLFAGRTLYMLVKQDIQSGEPRIRFSGDLIYNPTQSYPWELSSAFVLEAPKDKPYHIYFESGSIKITYVSAEERPVELITDSDIVNGKLGKMLDRSLVKYDVIYAEGASVEDARIDRYPNDKDPNGERTVILERTHVLYKPLYTAPIFGGSTADSGVIIEVPLDTKLTPYSNLTLDPKFAVAIVAPHFNITEELLGVGGQIIGSGASLYTAKSLGQGWLRNYLIKKGLDELAIHDAISKWAKVGTKWGPRGLFAVGVALAVDAGVELYAHYQTLENIRTTIYTIPIIVDTRTGEKYAVVKYYLPQEAMDYKDDFKEHVLSYLERVGIDRSNVGVTFTAPAGVQTWEDYENMLQNGTLPRPNLLELVKNNIVGVPIERLKIEKIIIVVDTITTGYTSLFDVITGGFRIPIATIVYGNSIQVSGTMPKFDTNDPEEIASLIPKVEINGQEYDVSPSTDGAVTQFALPVGTDKLVVKFPNAEHMRAWLQLKATTLVKTPMVDKGGYYEANFHYDWEYGENNLVIVTKRMEFVDMPYPMEYAEREIKLLYGRVEPLEITNYFELSQVIDDANSPSGKRYYYVTQDPKFLDPSNGARMQTCKEYTFRYWYTTPPQPYEPQPNETIPINGTQPLPTNNTSAIRNAWIGLYLNGTTNTSVIPRMLVVWVGSTGNESNTISVKVNMRAGYLDSEDRPIYTMNETRTFTVTVPPNSTHVQFYDIQKFIAEAIEHAPRGFFEAIGEITEATYNKVMSDDVSRVTYFPPPTLPPTETLVALRVKVVDAVNLTAVEGATVYLDGSLFGTTNAGGWANGTTITGLHKIKVEKSGYQTYESDLNVFDNMTYVVTLVPEGTIVTPPEPPTEQYTLTIKVRDAINGTSIQGASVYVDGNYIGDTNASGETSTTVQARCHEIRVEHPSYYTFNDTVCVFEDMTYIANLIPVTVTPPPTPTTVSLNVRVVDSGTQAPIQNAGVYLNGTLFGYTDSNGWINGTVNTGDYEIRVVADGYNSYKSVIKVYDDTTIVIGLTKITEVTFYKLEVLVQYQDGAPYEGASVTVKDNVTSATLFTQTTDTVGLARFVIEYGRVVDVFVTAGSYTFNFTGIVMDKDKRIVATVPENSSYFTPEVAISNVTFKIHWGQGWYYGETAHLVETWVFSNVPQTITLHYRAVDVDTNETLNETDLTVDIHKGTNYIMNWVYLAVRNETKKVATYVEITSYEQDTNLENNRMRSNIVVIKPFIDLSVTVLWKPVKQKTPLAILPEDVIEIDIGFMIPCKLSEIEIKADVNMHDLFTKKLRPLERHEDVVASFKPNTTIWYNTTVVVPFTDKIVVNASIHHPWEYMGWNNYINTTIKIFPDTEVSNVSIGALLVQSGQDVDITVKLRSNAIGRGTTVSVYDEDVGDVIGTTHVEISEPEMEVKLTATAPVIGQAVEAQEFNFNGVYETHTWNVSHATVDYWSENDYQRIQVTIWNIPWWVWLLILLIIIIFILAVVHALLTTVKERTRPRYRFFRRLEKEEEVSDRFGLTTEEKGFKKFRFFRKLK